MVENKECDEKSDIWSFGCLVYEIIRMKPCFNATNALLLAQKISKGDYEKINMEATNFHMKLLMLIDKCLIVDVNERADIHDVIAELI